MATTSTISPKYQVVIPKKATDGCIMMVGNFDVDVRHQQRLIGTSPTRNAK